MRAICLLFSLIFFAGDVFSQSQTITNEEYRTVTNKAVTTTNREFPFLFTVTTETYQSGKLLRKEVSTHERHGPGIERTKRSLEIDGKTEIIHQMKITFGEVYCSRDGATWLGPQQIECSLPGEVWTLTRPRTPDSTEYTVTSKKLNGVDVKVYRNYSEYSVTRPLPRKSFVETLSTVDSNGFYVEIVTTEGSLEPRVVTLTRKQTWKLDAKFAPIKAPK